MPYALILNVVGNRNIVNAFEISAYLVRLIYCSCKQQSAIVKDKRLENIPIYRLHSYRSL